MLQNVAIAVGIRSRQVQVQPHLKNTPAWLGFFVQLLATEEWVIFRGIVKWAPKGFTLTYSVLAVCKSLRPRPRPFR